MTARNLSEKKNYPHRLHTFEENVTIIEFVPRPGPNIPHVDFLQIIDETGGQYISPLSRCALIKP